FTPRKQTRHQSTAKARQHPSVEPQKAQRGHKKAQRQIISLLDGWLSFFLCFSSCVLFVPFCGYSSVGSKEMRRERGSNVIRNGKSARRPRMMGVPGATPVKTSVGTPFSTSVPMLTVCGATLRD